MVSEGEGVRRKDVESVSKGPTSLMAHMECPLVGENSLHVLLLLVLWALLI